VDSTSTSIIELGTFEYPFLNAASAFIELFNFYNENPAYEATVFLREGTISKIYSSIQPWILMGAKNLTITSYSTTG
jgi:hypothetical protein